MLKQPTLALDPATISRQRAIAADQSMARHDEADRVQRIGHPYCAGCIRLAENCRHLAVGAGFAGWNGAQGFPCLSLEIRAAAIDVYGMERREVALEIGADRRCGLAQIVCRFEDRFFPEPRPQHRHQPVLDIAELQCEQPAVIGHHMDGADDVILHRRLDQQALGL